MSSSGCTAVFTLQSGVSTLQTGVLTLQSGVWVLFVGPRCGSFLGVLFFSGCLVSSISPFSLFLFLGVYILSFVIFLLSGGSFLSIFRPFVLESVLSPCSWLQQSSTSRSSVLFLFSLLRYCLALKVLYVLNVILPYLLLNYLAQWFDLPYLLNHLHFLHLSILYLSIYPLLYILVLVLFSLTCSFYCTNPVLYPYFTYYLYFHLYFLPYLAL